MGESQQWKKEYFVMQSLLQDGSLMLLWLRDIWNPVEISKGY